MTNETKHTPTPWEVGGKHRDCEIFHNTTGVAFAREDYGRISGAAAKANAAHIVKCVNMHDELVERLRELLELTDDPDNDADECESVFVAARETIKKAGAL